MKDLKQLLIDDLTKKVSDAPFLFVVDYTGMKVSQFAELRRRLSDQNTELRVYKNTYIRRTGDALDYPEEIKTALIGQSAIVHGQSEAPTVAKILKNFHAEFQKGAVKCGILDGSYLGPAESKALASLPSKDVLRAQLLGVLNAPASKLVRTLNEPAASLARLLNTYKEKIS